MTYLEQIAKIIGKPVRVKRDANNGDHTIEIDENPATYYGQVATFSLKQLPGCCGVAVVYHLHVRVRYMRRGIGTIIMKMLEQLAHNYGYTALLATDKIEVADQPTLKLFSREKWSLFHTLVNRRTDNEVRMFLKALEDTGTKIGQYSCDFRELEDDEPEEDYDEVPEDVEITFG